ncbi:MAG: helix-turn-helix domain-containing protein [Agathobaculum sp.]
MQDYRELIIKKRKSCGLSQKQLAVKAGITQPFMNEIESGKKKPSIDVLFKLCEILGITIFPEE